MTLPVEPPPAPVAVPDDHRGCMACGAPEVNPASLGLVFAPTVEGGVAARFRPAPNDRGWDGRMHGGLIATLLDAAMTNALFARGVAAVTVDLAVRFLAPAPLDRSLAVSAEVIETRHGVHRVVGRLADGDHVLARATGRFMALAAGRPRRA
jgi:acyl-coenzyme A thioesterase PaaI-like protein